MDKTIITALIVAVGTLILQKVFLNLIYGVSLLFTNTFKKGEKIVITKNGNEIASGHVISRGLLQTKLKAYNRDVYILSNSELANCCVINSDYKQRTNHIDYLKFSLDSNLDVIFNVILNELYDNEDTLNTSENTNIIFRYDNGSIRVQYNIRTLDIDKSYVASSNICRNLIQKFNLMKDVTVV